MSMVLEVDPVLAPLVDVHERVLNLLGARLSTNNRVFAALMLLTASRWIQLSWIQGHS